MLNKIISTLQELPQVKFNHIWGEEIIAEATEMFKSGWDNLADGAVIIAKGDRVAIKRGNTIVRCESKDFDVIKGKLIGNVKEIRTIEVPEDKKEDYLAQAIITKYYTIRTY